MWMNILWLVIGLVLGAVIGFFVCKKVMENYLKKIELKIYLGDLI